MNNLILQHWNNLGKSSMPVWAERAQNSIKKFAKAINVEYQQVHGWPMGEFRGAVCQKLALLLEDYDEYDEVLMLDMDMIATKHIDNPFNYEGVGRLHLKAMGSKEATKQGRYWPALYKQGAPLFFGNWIKLTRQERIELRKHLPSEDMVLSNMSDPTLSRFNTSMPPNDEQTLHYCIWQSGILDEKKQLMVPHDRFCDLPEESPKNASMMHYCNTRKDKIIDHLQGIYGLELI